MAQRVYMIPVRDAFVEDYLALVLEFDEQALKERFDGMKRTAERHLRTLEAGKRFSSIAYEEIPPAQQDTRFSLSAAFRPYFITCTDSRDAAERTQTLYGHESLDALFKSFHEEAARLSSVSEETWDKVDRVSELDLHDAEWDALFEDLKRIRGMASAHRATTPYSVEVYKKLEIEGMEVFSQDETETVSVSGTQLGEHYGSLLGPNFGRLAGLTAPSWWLGRNFWLGLLAGVDLGKFAGVVKRKERKLQETIVSCARNPASLFSSAAVEGFESSFSDVCSGYGTGLYFPGPAIPDLIGTIEEDIDAATRLACEATGYPPDDVRIVIGVVLESLYWARDENCGLLEGDELVGSGGYR